MSAQRHDGLLHDLIAEPAGPVSAEQALLDAVPDAAAVLDDRGVIRAVNLAWRVFSGDNGGNATATGVGVDYLGVCTRSAAAGCLDAAAVCGDIRAVLAGRTVEREYEYACPSPSVGRWFMLRTTPLGGPQPGALVMHVSTTRRKAAELELERKANLDPLTGLANRSLLRTRLEAALTRRPGRVPRGDVAVLFLDLDAFKPVNDTYGHAAGDEILVETAGRLTSTVRPQDTVARVGGDEFVVVAPRMTEPGLRSLLVRIVAALEVPHQLHGRKVHVGVSLGHHLAAADEDVDAVLAAADARMYDDKRSRQPAGLQT